MKYPIASKMGLVLERQDGTLKLNEYKFFTSLDFSKFRIFEDSSCFRNSEVDKTKWDAPDEIKLQEVEKYLTVQYGE